MKRLRLGLIGLAVLLAHALLWLWLSAEGRRAAALKPASQLISLRLIAAKPAPAKPPPALAQPLRRSLAVPAAPRPAPTSQHPESTAITTPIATAAAAAAASSPALAASAPRLAPLLDSEATRRAVRHAARSAPLTASNDIPENAQQRLGREIGEAATSDCLKGEFAGAGMGLLSLPFWALAEARGKCRR
jgi:flagellar hook-length control protein FliK